jgi:hypothetical protein
MLKKSSFIVLFCRQPLFFADYDGTKHKKFHRDAPLRPLNNINSTPRVFQTGIHGLSANHPSYFRNPRADRQSDAFVNNKSRVA